MAQLEDFGKKIGGARKDMWKLHGITSNDFAEMNDMERSTHVKRDNIWIRPNWEKLIAEGTPQAVAYWQNQMRIAIPPKPPYNDADSQENYISIVSQLRDAVMAVKDQAGVEAFYQEYIKPNFSSLGNSNYFYPKPEADGIVTDKVCDIAKKRYSRLERDAKKKFFGIPKEDKAYEIAKQDLEVYCYDGKSVTLEPHSYIKDATEMRIKIGWCSIYKTLRQGHEFNDIDKWKLNTYFVLYKQDNPLRINFPTKEAAEEFVESFARGSQIAASINADSKGKENEESGRKKHFLPPQLSHVRYTGPNYRGIRPANGQMYLDDLKFLGGEFGNWLNANDRQTSLNMGYDALRNLADILKIPPEDISLNGTLSIAFGARGKGGANAGAAHYEPLRKVINLTKMSGAGCLAHEWFHALDDAIGTAAGHQELASEVKRKRDLPESFNKLVETLQYKEGLVSTDEQRKHIDPQLKKAQYNIKAYIADEKPKNLPEDLSKAWDEIVTRILENPQTFTGHEYTSYYRDSTIETHPDVEQLSQIRKFAVNRVIPRETKRQIMLWAVDLNFQKKRIAELQEKKQLVKTDFYKNSIEFDNVYSKHGHGYWQSTCEMLARAFDCYISDKLKERGYHSDYLSAHANSFSFRDGDRIIAAFPQGEEREAINKAFDELITELKERGLLHEAPEIEPVLSVSQDLSVERTDEELPPEPDKPVHYEQLSLDEILFAASTRAGQQTSGRHGNLMDRSR